MPWNVIRRRDLGRLAIGVGLATAAAPLGTFARVQEPRTTQDAAVTRAQALRTAHESAVSVEWLGWNFYRFTSPAGKVILANPFANNPDSPVTVDDIARADLILITNGHGDEVGQTVEIAQNTGARTLSPFELGTWLIEQGVPEAQVNRTNPGGRFVLDGIVVRVVQGVHGSGLPRPTARVPYGGPAVAYFITFEDGWTVFYGGSSAATGDMALWAELYRPDAAILVLSSGTEPMDFALSARLLARKNPNLWTILPGHHRVVQQPGQTSIAEAQAVMDEMGLGLQITEPVIGEAMSFT